MEWFTGDVGSAIGAAKQRKSIFCVYVVGEDEMSTKLVSMTETEDFKDRYKDMVCIKIDQASTTFTQFSQIYPVFMVPSIFYINSATGVDIEVTVTTNDEKSVIAGLERALQKFNEPCTTTTAKTPPATSNSQPTTDNTPVQEANKESNEIAASEEAGESAASEVAADTEASTSAAVHERVNRAREMLNDNVGVIGDVQGHDTPTSLEERVSRAKDLIQQKREEKSKEESDKEKNLEKERRQLGKDVQDMQRKQEDQKIQEMVRERQKEREEEKAAKARVQAQIEQDRLDRAERYKREKDEREELRKEKEREALAEQAARADRDAAERSTISRIQFRLPDGRSRTQQFPAESQLDEVYTWVSTSLDSGFSKFSLSTTFPRRNLDDQSRSITLKELQLAPSGTILVLPATSSSLSTSDGSLMSFLMLLLSPFTFLWSLISSFINPPPSRQDPPSSGQNRNAGNRRSNRAGNIGRIGQFSDDDEQNTYNGNSTQQQ